MKLATFTYAGKTSIGKLIGDDLLDISKAFPELPQDMRSLIAAGESALSVIRDAAAKPGCMVPVAAVKLEAPVLNPSKILAIGMNYQKHVEESERIGVKAPERQFWFNKQVSCVNGPFDPIHRPRVSDQLDYEAELGVVIGTRCRHVTPQDAHKYIAGYLCINDASVRDWQKHSPTFTLGKSFDTTGPMGPFLVTAEDIKDPHNLKIRGLVNGEVRQESVTGLMIHSIYEQIAYLSTAFTLEPGDVLATGTPEGVGVAMVPPVFLKPGDKVRVEIEGIGFIENPVIAEPN